MGGENAVVAIYHSRTDAEEAVRELQKSGYNMTRLSIIGQGYHTHIEECVTGYYSTGNRMKRWGKLGAFRGSIWSLLSGAAFFVIPGIGPILGAGPVVSWIVGALEGAVAVGGLSALGAGLCGIGIRKDSALEYETALKTAKFLLIAHGSQDDVTLAKEILHATPAIALEMHAGELAMQAV
jgi:hypothetical protein